MLRIKDVTTAIGHGVNLALNYKTRF